MEGLTEEEIFNINDAEFILNKGAKYRHMGYINRYNFRST